MPLLAEGTPKEPQNPPPASCGLAVAASLLAEPGPGNRQASWIPWANGTSEYGINTQGVCAGGEAGWLSH